MTLLNKPVAADAKQPSKNSVAARAQLCESCMELKWYARSYNHLAQTYGRRSDTTKELFSSLGEPQWIPAQKLYWDAACNVCTLDSKCDDCVNLWYEADFIRSVSNMRARSYCPEVHTGWHCSRCYAPGGMHCEACIQDSCNHQCQVETASEAIARCKSTATIEEI